jgi:glyoxylase I family protein
MNYIHHIVLTVSDSKKSADFYQKVLDWKITEQKDDYAYLCPDNEKYPDIKFMLVLGEVRDVKSPIANFNRNNTGLDHFAFNVESSEELKTIENRLKSLSVDMEVGGITDDDFGGTAIFCTDPDGMKVEFHLDK